MSSITIKSSLVGGLVALALGLSSCGAAVPIVLGSDVPSNEPAPTSTYDPMDSTDEPSDDPTDEPVNEDTEFKFGETVIYDNGLQVTLSKLKTLKPTEYSSHGKEKDFVQFKVTVKNGTAGKYDPNDFYMTATTGDKESEQVFDSEQDILGSPSTSLRKGRTVTWISGFGVKKGSEFVVEVSPGYVDTEDYTTYDSVQFVGVVK